MKFSLLLWGLKFLLKRTAKKSPEFKNKLKEKNYTVLIKTEDGKRGRSYTFKDGEIISRTGDSAVPDLTLIWRDPKTGFDCMVSGRTKVFMKALQEGSLKILGDGNIVPIFLTVVQDMLKRLFRKK